MLSNLISQAATMELHGTPNDIISNLDPFSLIIFIPLMDNVFYPALRRLGLKFTPIKRITVGFFVASCSMVAAAVTQHYIYKLGPCGKFANKCAEQNIAAPINVWVQTVPYIFGSISEIFAIITIFEYAFTKAPKNMRSLVQAIALFTLSAGAALSQALVSLSDDPLLEWNYGVAAILSFVGCIGFWVSNRATDAEEDTLNNLPKSHFQAQAGSDIEKAQIKEG